MPLRYVQGWDVLQINPDLEKACEIAVATAEANKHVAERAMTHGTKTQRRARKKAKAEREYAEDEVSRIVNEAEEAQQAVDIAAADSSALHRANIRKKAAIEALSLKTAALLFATAEEDAIAQAVAGKRRATAKLENEASRALEDASRTLEAAKRRLRKINGYKSNPSVVPHTTILPGLQFWLAGLVGKPGTFYDVPAVRFAFELLSYL